MLLGSDRLGVLARDFISGPARHWGVEHFQRATAGIDLVVMGEIGEAFEDAEQLLVPGRSPDFYIAGAALRAEWPEPRQLIAALPSRIHAEAAECAHEVKGLVLTGLPRILAEPDADLFAVLRRGVDQQSLDIARVGAPAHHVQQPIAPISIAAEFDADRPIGVVELGLFGGGEIPIADNVVKVRRDLVDDGAPLALEIEPGGRPDFPIAPQQPLALKQRQRPQPGDLVRVDPQQCGVVEHARWDKCDADRPRQLGARRQILRPRQVLHQILRPIGPFDLVCNSNIIAQNTSSLWDWKPGLRVDPPRQKVGNPTVRIGIACRAEVRPYSARRAIPADHVEELMGSEMRQLIETDQCDLGTLPVIDRGVKLQVRKLNLAAASPAPLTGSQVCSSTDSWI